MRWAEHVARMWQKRCAYKILLEKAERKKSQISWKTLTYMG